MASQITYRLEHGVATVSMDDGNVNALSPSMLADLNGALDRAGDDGAAVVLHGRPGVLSAGFDLTVLAGGGPAAVGMLRAGFELCYRMLAFPRPIVIACTGHAIAMGAFLLLSGDYRIGVVGDHKIVANEVAIGLTVPRAAVEICRQRLTPTHFSRAVNLSEQFSPERAVDAGFLDELASADQLPATVTSTAARLAGLNPDAHVATKQRTRASALAALRAAIDADNRDLETA